jgi:hypothetical protein
MNKHTVIQELLEVVNSIRSFPKFKGRTRENTQGSSGVVREMREEHENGASPQQEVGCELLFID